MIAGLIAVAVLGPIVGIRELDAAASAETVVDTAGDVLDEMVRAQLAEELGLRGYVQTRSPDVLVPDGPPSPSFAVDGERLRGLVTAAGLPGALPIIDAILADHDRWEREVAQPVLRGPPSADSALRATNGKLLTDTMRALAGRLRETLEQAAVRQRAKLAGRIDATVAVSTGLILLFAVAAVLLGLDRASALDRLEREHLLLDAVQRTLRVGGSRLPQTVVAYAHASATRDSLVGGDLLDAWKSGDCGWFLIADASGKGVEAARHAAFVQYAVRALAGEHDDPSTILERFNRLFIDTFADPSAFVALFLARFDLERGTLGYASAGHGTAFLRCGTSVTQLAPTGAVIGLLEQECYGLRELRLRRGDTVVLATDGLSEARGPDGVLLGDEGVAELLREAPPDPQAICDVLVAEVKRRSEGTIRDDLAILVIELADGLEAGAADLSFTTLEAEAPP